MKKITVIMWHTYANIMKQVKNKVNDIVDLKVYSARFLDEGKEDLSQALKDMETSDLIFFYRSASENIWSELENEAKILNIPFICTSSDSIFWAQSTIDMKIVAECQRYIVYGGEENYIRMLHYVSSEVLGIDAKYDEPLILPWEGIYHPDSKKYFTDIDEYLDWYKPKKASTLGILISRGNWVNNNLEAEKELIRLMESKGYNVIPIFCYSLKNTELGTRDSAEIIQDYFMGHNGKTHIDGLIKMVSFFIKARSHTGDYLKKDVASSGVELLKELNVPVFEPVIAYYTTVQEWEESEQGLNRDIAWSVAMPEFEGVIEPVIVAAQKQTGEIESKEPIHERCEHLASRIDKWIKLAQKPVEKRKVAFILHNNPCASVEASVGGGANLDTLESVSEIIKRMKDAGYNVDTPKNGKDLIDTIMSKKAISEFRWTTADEIVKKGGVLKFLPVEEYRKWFDSWPIKAQEKIIKAWGNPPGEKINEIPPSMLYDGKIMITGVSYGNAVVCVQPKRGCAGTRCDGQVCKILHDPDVPPTHQYLATYRYLEEGYGADVLVHVGTHGNLEFLPGKGVGLSNSCFPDIAIGTIPHLYIYNSDNPAEGTIAKRRSNAVLIDHMQTVMVSGGLYDKLAQLDNYLEEYEKAKMIDPMRAHTLEHLILDEIKKSNLDKQINIMEYKSFNEVTEKAHEILTLIRNTSVQDGQHIFGKVPQGDRRVDFINSILRFDSGERISLRKSVAKMMGLNFGDLKSNEKGFNKNYGKSNGALLEAIDAACKGFIGIMIKGNKVNIASANEILDNKLQNSDALNDINSLMTRVLELNERIEESKEMDALLTGFEGKYIPAGPSGLIIRGREDVLPTGRNFYSLDPYKAPTKASWKVGMKLADKVIEKYQSEEGRYPENVAIQWMCTDIMCADGEGLAQMMYLIGVKPKWALNGHISGFEILPADELKRPRIDLTVRPSSIIRDNFPNCIDLLDEAIQKVAMLDEPIEKNYIRKHTLEKLNGKTDNEAIRNATFRIFTSQPGTYQSGVNLAVYSSAWKDEKDLSDVFEYWNGYAYGKGTYGKEAFKELKTNLQSVDLTYNKVISDENDLFGCCCYFGTQGGMTAAARVESKKDVKTYYGDTRDPEYVEVRTLSDEVRRVVRTKLLNPKWIEGQKRHGYKGASDISKRIGRVYGWEATTGEVDDWIFDDITKTFISNEENRKFFKENNPWAMEEIARRLLEAEKRGLWKANPEMLNDLKEYYIEIEGWIEEKMGDVDGDFQGGSIDIYTAEEIGDFKSKMEEMKKKLK